LYLRLPTSKATEGKDGRNRKREGKGMGEERAQPPIFWPRTAPAFINGTTVKTSDTPKLVPLIPGD